MRSRPVSAKQWFGWTVCLAAAICLLVAGVNFVIDPWGLNGAVSVAGFNERKPDPLAVARLHKAHAVVRQKPAAVALGSSTSEHGLDMRHPAWRDFGSVYNLSIPGASIAELDAFLRAAHRVSPIKRAVIGLDLFSFNAHLVPNVQSEQALEAMRSVWGRIQYYFTRGMLAAALDTVLRQPFLFTYFLPSGQSSEHAFEQWRVRSNGHHNLFAHSVGQTVRGLLPKPAHRFEFQRGREVSTLERFRRLLEFARHESIELQVFISPSHAWHLETINAIGLWPSFEYFKQQLAGIVEPYSHLPSGAARVTLWDFAVHNAVTAERVPTPNDVEAQMRWFWDAMHYKVEFGVLIQDHMSGSATPAAPDSNIYGVQLTAQNVDAHLLALRERQKHYADSHKSDIAKVQAIAAKALASLGAD